MTHKVGEIYETNIGKNKREVKQKYYALQLPKGVMKFKTLELAEKWKKAFFDKEE